MASDKTRVACPATALNVICMMHDDVYGPGKGLKTALNVISILNGSLHSMSPEAALLVICLCHFSIYPSLYPCL